jgi:hypothetical protein
MIFGHKPAVLRSPVANPDWGEASPSKARALEIGPVDVAIGCENSDWE